MLDAQMCNASSLASGVAKYPGTRRICSFIRVGIAPRPVFQIPNFKSQISNFKSQISNLKSQISNLKSQIRNRTIAARWALGLTNTLPAKMKCHPNVPAIFTTPRRQSRVNETPAVPRSCSARKPFLLQLWADRAGHLKMFGNLY